VGRFEFSIAYLLLVELLQVDLDRAQGISAYGAKGIAVGGLFELEGDIAVNVLRFSAGSHLPQHRAGRPQLFLVLEGEGWVTGADQEKHSIRAGQAAFWSEGEPHGSGSVTGMLAVIVQAPHLDLPGDLQGLEHPAILVAPSGQ
jgi:quercetin dioxygenase-like cupin family protein